MPPIHPALVHFPIALITFSVLADLFALINTNQYLAVAGWWALVAGALGGVAAAVAGYIDMKRADIEPEAHKRVHTHQKVGIVLLLLVVLMTAWRWMIRTDAAWDINWFYLLFGFGVVGVVFFQAWLGGELVYGYGVGVAEAGQGTEPPPEAKERVEKVLGETEEEGSEEA